MRSPAALLGVLLIVGCGGSAASEDAAPQPAASTVKAQHVEHYEAEVDRAQAERLFAHTEDDVDPATLAGHWTLDLNTTLGILETRAPDGGGPVLDIVRTTGNTLFLKERMCPGGFTLEMHRTSAGIRFDRGRGRCPETIDLLIDIDWRRTAS